MVRVKMLPHPTAFTGPESGLKRVVSTYYEMLPDFGVKMVDGGAKSFDVLAVHAGLLNDDFGKYPLVAHLHGLYWTGDYQASKLEHDTNAQVIATAVAASAITVPSEWVADAIKRDLRVIPYVIPHGILCDEWKHNKKNGGYVLWNKNRVFDVCNPDILGDLAVRFPEIMFVTTFASQKDDGLKNIIKIGVQPHDKMKEVVQSAGIYLSTTKETFGINTLEAMSAGVPVLGYAHGGNLDLVQHGVNGYLASPGNINDLADGLRYCIANAKTLGDNGRVLAKQWTWESSIEKLSNIYKIVAGGDVRKYKIPKELYAR